MLVKQHAMETAPHGITVNGVTPTFIQPDRIRRHLDRLEVRDFIPERGPPGQIGPMTGQIVCVHGGVTASQ
jgi:NAD(P)-dependent dehydrogenase (short-subunit alcohol dehydrogenase family)